MDPRACVCLGVCVHANMYVCKEYICIHTYYMGVTCVYKAAAVTAYLPCGHFVPVHMLTNSP